MDKPPASLWLMELSSRIFGFSSFSMLLPQALEGVASVALLYATVRRWFGRPAALLSGLILALTPVAALMFRFNNPDALLLLLFVASAYALTRALESGATRWLLLAGAAVGFAFLTKELQALLVLPAFGFVYLVAAPVRLRRRLGQLLGAGATMVLSAGWWVALVQLWPAGSRPYFGDSTSNSILQVIFGSNGLQRLSSGGLGGGPGPGGGFSGSAGILRLFNAELGGQIGWLLPAAVIALAAGLAWTARRPRTDRTRAALLLWGGWLLITAAVFSFMTGVIHPYYTNSLAPAVAVLVGVSITVLWRERDHAGARIILASMLALTAVVSYLLLDRAASWHPWLRYAILAGGLGTAAWLVAAQQISRRSRRTLAAAGILAALAGPTAYTLDAISSTQSGSNPMAGPQIASVGGGFVGPGGAFAGAGGAFAGGRPGFARPGGGVPGAQPGFGGQSGPSKAAQGFGPGDASSVSRALSAALEQDAARYTWVAATSSSQNGASLELSTGRPVMAIGGFGGSDPAITLARFKQLVTQGKIHYYVAGGGSGPGLLHFASSGAPPGLGGAELPPQGPVVSGGYFGRRAGGGPGGKSVAGAIESWVTKHFRSNTVGGTTLYNLTEPKTRS